ncbi:hypothetical protein S14_72 [Shewanella sp. phage 1/4]|uniref:hypothetical protein n=1 Tax=Shewanella phage 1/4 TaxID=1458859 RepID=UPI0004F86667|nr:hypothetical protein S14_72 [Shewanella sp. phage 1/4]AHK11184.1 hypothetical protein S14_72 [Shewanella sp. phage 1/4]
MVQFIVELPDKRIELDESKRQRIIEEGNADISQRLKLALYVQKSIQKRLDAGLKTNKINADEIRRVIEHWYANGRGVLTKSFKKVYDESPPSKTKEVDWVTDIGGKTYFNKEFRIAVDSIKLKDFVKLRESKLFTYGTNNTPLTTRIRQMEIAAIYEELLEDKDKALESKDVELLKKDDEISMLRAELEVANSLKRDWDTIALSYREKGFTQKQIAELVGKSLSTIKRLFAENRVN